MRTLLFRALALSSTLAVAPGTARPAEQAAIGIELAQETDWAPEAAEPSTPAPDELPPPPTAEAPGPDAYQAQAPAQQAAAQGQWVYTQQYGWIWMPYGNAYTYLPPAGGVPSMYVYYPAVGWSWVIAPWVWGFGPMPYFGIYGTWRFGWYGHGFGHWYGFQGRYAAWHGHGYWHGGRWNGSRGAYPAPPRGAPAPRGLAPRGGRAAPPRYHQGSGRAGFAAARPHYVAPGRGPSAAPRGGFAGRGGSGGSGGPARTGHTGSAHGGGGHGRGDRGHR